MTTSQMHEFARVGAEARLKAIAEEQQQIFAVFPQLRAEAAPARRASSPAASTAHKRGMSPAQRQAVGERMKAYWAQRRGEKAAPKGAGRKRRGGMSAEARKAQAERMRSYWAQRRTQKQAGGDGAPAQAAETAAETFAARRTGRQARRKATRKAGRRQARKK